MVVSAVNKFYIICSVHIAQSIAIDQNDITRRRNILSYGHFAGRRLAVSSCCDSCSFTCCYARYFTSIVNCSSIRIAAGPGDGFIGGVLRQHSCSKLQSLGCLHFSSCLIKCYAFNRNRINSNCTRSGKPIYRSHDSGSANLKTCYLTGVVYGSSCIISTGPLNRASSIIRRDSRRKCCCVSNKYCYFCWAYSNASGDNRINGFL